MVCAEEYLLWNAAMNLLTLPLGGRMAGLPAPRRRCLAQACDHHHNLTSLINQEAAEGDADHRDYNFIDLPDLWR